MLVLFACTVAACGRKGSPLTPLVLVPAEVAGVSPQRMGDDVYVTMTVPAQNVDASKPAAISRIEVYAATSMTPPPRARFLEIANLIATVPVAAVPAPGEPPPLPTPPLGAVQGTTVTVRDALTDRDLVPRALEPLGREPAAAAAPAATAAPQYLRRFYQAIPFDLRGRPGPPSAIVELPLAPLPEPPSDVRATFTATTATVQWEPAGGLLAWLLDNVVLMPERPPLDDLPRPAAIATPSPAGMPIGQTMYLVYREQAADPLQLPPARDASAWSVPAPGPVAAAPSLALSFSQPIALDERTICYRVRSVRGGVIGAPSEPACITPTDVYPPAVPTNLVVAPAEGQITVFWESNTELDLGGYIVFRRQAGSDVRQPLMLSPIIERNYVDRDVKAGVQYFYSVAAADQRLPLPNLSPYSPEESGTAR